MLLVEELLLLALDDASGKISYSATPSLTFGLVGGLLMDLMFRGRIALTERQRVKLVDLKPTGDPLLDDALKRMEDLGRELTLRSWIIQLSVSFRNIYAKGVLTRLVDQGLLGREEHNRLKIFHALRHPLVKPEIKDALLQRIEDLFVAGKPADAHLAALLCLVENCNLINSLFRREYRAAAAAHIKSLLASNALEGKTKEFVLATSSALATLLFKPTYAKQKKVLGLFPRKSK